MILPFNKNIIIIFKQLFIAVFVFAFFTSKAQNNRAIDSLQNLIKQSPEDTNKVNLIFSLSRQYNLYSSKEYLNYMVDALLLAKKINYKNGIIKLSKSVVLNAYYKGIYDLSMTYCLDYIDFLESEKLENEKYIIYKVLGNLYLKQGNEKEALHYYHKGKNYLLKKENYGDYAGFLNSLSLYYLNKQQYDSALFYSLGALDIYKRNNSMSAMANSILAISEIYLAQGNVEEAKQKSSESFSIYKNINEKHGICNSIQEIGKYYLKINKPDSALSYFKLALLYADSINMMNLKKDCHQLLSNAYIKLNKYKEAYESHLNYKLYSDSLASENLKGKMLEMEVKYDISKKESELKEKQQQIELNNKQRNFLLMGLLGLVLLFLVSFRAYIQKKKSNTIISEQKQLVEDKQKELLDSLNYAKRIQKGIMPDENEFNKLFKNNFILYKPKDIVSGDFYWFVKLEDKSLNKNIAVFAAADCTGHGVPGAFMSMLNSALLNQTILNSAIKTCADVLDYINTELPKNLKAAEGELHIKDGMDIALCIFDFNTRQLQFAGANNPCWIVRDNQIIELKPTKQAITASDEFSKIKFTNEVLQLRENDCVYLFTDGYADQFGGPKGKKFKYKQLKEILIEIQNLTMHEQKQILENTFEKWKGELEQVDDICIIGIKI